MGKIRAKDNDSNLLNTKATSPPKSEEMNNQQSSWLKKTIHFLYFENNPYLIMQYIALKPSFQFIFLPS